MGSPVFLLADIGATNARFALGCGGSLVKTASLPTSRAGNVLELVEMARGELGFDALAGSVIAVAGPVHNGRGAITNGTLEFDGATLGTLLNCRVTVVNDFHAIARSLPVLKRLRKIGGRQQRTGPKAVVGPGSGLGMAVLMGGSNGWLVLPSEGGHADMAPGTPLEQEVLRILLDEHEQVSWETVLSGPGLVNLSRAVCVLWGTTPQEVTPEWITRSGVGAAEPICHQVLELFFGILGGAAGNLALTVCAQGGVYIGGGIVPRLEEFAVTSSLRRRFDERGTLGDYAEQIPLYLILDENPGLVGALQILAGADMITNTDAMDGGR
ncbi:MAG: glucokinase [Gammaproteobacteria bacterium]|nr:glucokinase [Gammaproteobacteria bacterium]